MPYFQYRVTVEQVSYFVVNAKDREDADRKMEHVTVEDVRDEGADVEDERVETVEYSHQIS